MTIKTAEPLPECSLCEAPTARKAWEDNGGLCTRCAAGIADTVRMLLPTGVADIQDARARRRRLQATAQLQDDATVYVERYTPPVPGQLVLGDSGMIEIEPER